MEPDRAPSDFLENGLSKFEAQPAAAWAKVKYYDEVTFARKSGTFERWQQRRDFTEWSQIGCRYGRRAGCSFRAFVRERASGCTVAEFK